MTRCSYCLKSESVGMFLEIPCCRECYDTIKELMDKPVNACILDR